MSLEDLVWMRRLLSSGGARALRQRAELSLAEVAEELAVSPAAVSRWETGVRRPRGHVAMAYCQLLRDLVARELSDS